MTTKKNLRTPVLSIFPLRKTVFNKGYPKYSRTSVPNSARTPLFCSSFARYPKKFSALRAVFIIFANIEGSLVLTPQILIYLIFNVSALYPLNNQINHEAFSIFLQPLCISLMPLIFPYSAQILLENALFFR